MKTCWGSGGTAPRIISFGSRWTWVVSFTSLPLYLRGKSSRYPLDRRLDRSQSCCGRSGEDRKSLPLPGIDLRSSSL